MIGQIPWIINTLHLFPQAGRTIQEFDNFGQSLATQRMKNGAVGTKDLWYHLASSSTQIAKCVLNLFFSPRPMKLILKKKSQLSKLRPLTESWLLLQRLTQQRPR